MPAYKYSAHMTFYFFTGLRVPPAAFFLVIYS